jgi:putative transcriptional regulator
MYSLTKTKCCGEMKKMGIQARETTIFKLKGLRAENNLTQGEIAEKLNISKATYARKENGICQFDAQEIARLTTLFQVKYEDIFQLQS